MLGLADRSKTLLLFKEVLSGNEKGALKYLRELINDGIDAKNFSIPTIVIWCIIPFSTIPWNMLSYCIQE